jgi:hypothetical protein
VGVMMGGTHGSGKMDDKGRYVPKRREQQIMNSHGGTSSLGNGVTQGSADPRGSPSGSREGIRRPTKGASSQQSSWEECLRGRGGTKQTNQGVITSLGILEGVPLGTYRE